MPKRSAKKKLPDPNSRRANVVRKKLGMVDVSPEIPGTPTGGKAVRSKGAPGSDAETKRSGEDALAGIMESVKTGEGLESEASGRDGVKRQMYMGRKYWDFVDVESVKRRVRLGRKVYLYEIVEEALDLLMEKSKLDE